MSHSFDWRCIRCERPNQYDFVAGNLGSRHLHCAGCGYQRDMAAEAFDDDGDIYDPLNACLACGSNKLFTQKDFNRKLGLAVVVAGAALSPWTYGLSLVACMAFDYGLYYIVPEITVCYACDAIYRGFAHNPAHRAHDPLLAERYRREARSEIGLPSDTEDAGGKRAEAPPPA